MKNPFEYGGVVSGDAFCNRRKELAEMLRAMLLAKDVIDRDDGSFVISDRCFRLDTIRPNRLNIDAARRRLGEV